MKRYASDRAPVVAGRVASLAAGPAEPVVPRVLACVPADHLVVLSEVPGVPLSQVPPAVAAAGAAVGRWHAWWAGRGPEPLRPYEPERELVTVDQWIERADPAASAAAAAVLSGAHGTSRLMLIESRGRS